MTNKKQTKWGGNLDYLALCFRKQQNAYNITEPWVKPNIQIRKGQVMRTRLVTASKRPHLWEKRWKTARTVRSVFRRQWALFPCDEHEFRQRTRSPNHRFSLVTARRITQMKSNRWKTGNNPTYESAPICQLWKNLFLWKVCRIIMEERKMKYFDKTKHNGIPKAW